jgi:cobalt-zinc-cadmium efflux system outer membrane protein
VEPTGVLTLQQALSLALMNSPELLAYSWEERAAQAQALQAGLLPNPELSVEFEEFAGTGEFSDGDATETTIQLTQVIELGGKRGKRKQAASIERRLAEWDYEIKRLDLFADTTRAFVDVLAAQERLALSGELAGLAEKVLHTVSERVRAGKVSPIEETRATVLLSSGRIELDRAELELESARARLVAAWGGAAPSFERVEGDFYTIAPMPSYDQLEKRISQTPELARTALETEQRTAMARLAKSGAVPDLSVGFGVRQFKEIDDTAYVAEMSLPVPLFDRNQAGVSEAHSRQARSFQEQKAEQARSRARLSEAYHALTAAYIEATVLRDDVLPGAESVFNAVGEGYRAGKFGYLEMLDAQRTLFEAKARYVEALAEYHKAVADVERMIGMKLDELKEGGELISPEETSNDK